MKMNELRDALQAVPGYREAEERALPGKEVALAVARLRARYGWTQRELANYLGTRRSVVVRLESGRVGAKELAARFPSLEGALPLRAPNPTGETAGAVIASYRVRRRA